MPDFENLGTEVKFTDEIAVRDLNATLNAHRAEILRLRSELADGKRTAAELAEWKDKAGADLLEVSKRVKVGSTSVWVPGGDASDLTRRFLRPDGTVQLGTVTQSVPLPRGGSREIKRAGLLTEHKPLTREHGDLVNAFYRYAFALELGKRNMTGALEAADDVWARSVVPAMQAMPGPVGDYLRSLVSDPVALSRAMNASSTTGGELISNPTLGTALRAPLTLPRLVAGRIARQRSLSKTFTAPIVTGRGLLRKQGAISDDPARATPQSMATTSAAVTMVDFIVNALVQSTFFRDIASSGIDGITLLMTWLDQAVADSEELILLHGDTAATHQDTINTWTMGGYLTSGQLGGTDSPIVQILGIRARAHDDSATASASGTFDAADHFGALALMGNWGAGAVMSVGVNGIYTLLANALFTTVDKAGPRATLQTGQIGFIGNTPVDISEFLPKQFDTTSGLRTGSNEGNIATYHNPAAMTMWDMEPAEGGEYDVSEPHKGARYVGRTATMQVTFNVPSGDKPCAVLYNLG